MAPTTGDCVRADKGKMAAALLPSYLPGGTSSASACSLAHFGSWNSDKGWNPWSDFAFLLAAGSKQRAGGTQAPRAFASVGRCWWAGVTARSAATLSAMRQLQTGAAKFTLKRFLIAKCSFSSCYSFK